MTKRTTISPDGSCYICLTYYRGTNLCFKMSKFKQQIIPKTQTIFSECFEPSCEPFAAEFNFINAYCIGEAHMVPSLKGSKIIPWC